MENQALDIKDYLKILKRRRKYLLIPLLAILLISAILAVFLPSMFRSTSTILIEAQEIPTDLVRSTVTTFADQRIQVISQRIMTRPNLMDIIKKYDLYPDDRKSQTEERILETMRERIKVETISANVSDKRSNNAAEATIAFTLTFDDRSAALSQRVANELTSLFLKENIKSRTESAENAALFLSEEAKRLRAKLAEIQNTLALFKEKNLNQLPQISALNQQELTTLSNQLLSLDSQERSLQDRRFYLEGQLAQIDPNAMAVNATGNRVFDTKDRLKELQAQYPSVLASHSPTHPDVLKIKREIDSLQKEIGSNTDLNNLNAELTDKKAELALLLKQYSEKHPDVLKLQKQISALQKNLIDSKQNEYSNPNLQPDNPAYITLKSQMDSVNSEIESLNYSRGRINTKIDELRHSLRQAPLVEKEYTDIIQELDNTNLRYREVSAREMEAQISQQLEMERKGERFTLIDPPQEPLEPVSPNRLAILFLGLVLAFASGIGSVALAETLDSTINNEKAITALLGIQPLASIPYLESRREKEAKTKRRNLLLLTGLLIGIAGSIIFHFFVIPLDVFWYRLLRVVSTH